MSLKDYVSDKPSGLPLRKELLLQLTEAIEQHKLTLHPEDAQMAPMELRSWMKACDNVSQEDLDFYVSRAWRTIRSVQDRRTDKEQRLFAMRSPHATYALAALNTRFGVDRSAEVTA